ncbi:MAG: hypothetical protein VYE22_07065 [Myxococcota bacterium]|nr:hypothetical protein [Myxococcota bacterium]
MRWLLIALSGSLMACGVSSAPLDAAAERDAGPRLDAGAPSGDSGLADAGRDLVPRPLDGMADEALVGWRSYGSRQRYDIVRLCERRCGSNDAVYVEDALAPEGAAERRVVAEVSCESTAIGPIVSRIVVDGSWFLDWHRHDDGHWAHPHGMMSSCGGRCGGGWASDAPAEIRPSAHATTCE